MTKLIGALVLGMVLTSVAAAQTPPSATAVLSNVQHYYANATQLSALFRQTVTNATFQTSRTSDGQLWVVKPTYFRWDYLTKQNAAVVRTKSFIFDGKTLWVIDHDNKQIIQSTVQSSVMPAAVSFVTGGTALSAQFSVAITTSGTYGSKGDFVLELTPNQPSAQYKRLVFVVDPTNWRVKASIVIASNGDTNRFDFFTPDLTSAIEPSWFQVNPASLPSYKLVKP